jgi:membrane associated rhomboid family serine protease
MNSIFQEIKQSFKNGGTLVKLIYINLGVFLFYNLLRVFLFLGGSDYGAELTKFLAVPAYLPNLAQRPWTIFSYMFFHEGFIHILFNLLWLYWLGRIFLSFMSERKLLGVYIMGGVSGAALYILFYNIFPVFSGVLPISFALGASASVLAIVFAAATFAPNLQLHLMFIGPVKLKYIAIFMVALDIIGMAGSNAGGHIAHLGGALFGYLFIYFQKQNVNLVKPVEWFIDAFTGSPSTKRRKKMKVEYTKTSDDYEYNRIKAEKQAEIDRILDKISKGGYDSLTAEEKKTLFKMKDS